MNDIRKLIETIDRVQLTELNKKDRRKVDNEVDKINPGESTYDDVISGYENLDTWTGSLQNHFLGDVAKKLGVKGLFKPDSATMGGLVFTVQDENSTRYKETGAPFGMWGGLDEDEIYKLAELDMLDRKRMREFRKDYPDLYDKLQGKSKEEKPKADDKEQTNNETVTVQPTTDGKFQVVDADGKLIKGGFASKEEATKFAKTQTTGAITFATKAQKAAAGDKETKTAGDSNKLKLADGSTFYRDPTSIKQLNVRAAKLVRRLNALLRKMNESVPNSLKGYIVEHNLGSMLLEALSPNEEQELAQIYSDLYDIATFKDEQGLLISDKNSTLLIGKLRGIKDVVDRINFPDGGQPGGPWADKATGSIMKDKGNVDYSSDEEIEKAKEDAEGYISDSMPDELKQFSAKGLKKATNNGQRKSASAAAVQNIIRRIGFINNNRALKKIAVDGWYGTNTQNGVKRAQKLAGLTVDGDAGENTAKALVQYARDPEKGQNDAMKADMARIKELISKSREVYKIKDSVDFRSLISLVEGNLYEELSDEEKKELGDLLRKYKDRMEDPEANQLYPQYVDIYNSGKTAFAGGDGSADKTDDEEEEKKPSIEDLMTADEFATGIHDALTDGWFFGLGTEEEALYAILAKIKDAKQWKDVSAIYQKRFGADIMSDIRSELSGDELKNVQDMLKRIGVGDSDQAIKSGMKQQGLAPQSEQTAKHIVVYWEGEKYFVDAKPDANGGFKGKKESPDGWLTYTVTDPELLEIVTAEWMRRQEEAKAKNGSWDAALKRAQGAEMGSKVSQDELDKTAAGTDADF